MLHRAVRETQSRTYGRLYFSRARPFSTLLSKMRLLSPPTFLCHGAWRCFTARTPLCSHVFFSLFFFHCPVMRVSDQCRRNLSDDNEAAKISRTVISSPLLPSFIPRIRVKCSRVDYSVCHANILVFKYRGDFNYRGNFLQMRTRIFMGLL